MASGWGNNVQAFDSRDSKIEISKGNIQGHRSFAIVSTKINIGTTERTMWDIDADFVWPTGNEAWEIVSDNVNDDFGGTGAHVVLITGLDSNFDRQEEFINMDGTSLVATARTDWNMIDSIVVVLSGSGQRNAGTITLRVLGGGNIRATALPGNSLSFNCFFKVPRGKYFMILSIVSFSPKGSDINIKAPVMFDGTNTWISSGIGPTYQSTSFFYEQTPFLFNPLSSEEIRVDSTNSSITGTVVLEILEIDEGLVSL